MKKISFIVLISVLSLKAHSVGFFNSVANNISSGGELCTLITQENYDQFASGLKLSEKSLPQSRYDHPLIQFENLVYRQSLNFFENKTSCMSDYSDAVLSSNDAIDEIRRTIAPVWLNKKKASLILAECKVILAEASAVASGSVGLTGAATNAYSIESLQRRNPKIKSEYYPICMNTKQVKALQSVVTLANRSLPVFSSRDLLMLMEKYRSILISKMTGKPVTDDEIRTLDLDQDRAALKVDRTQVSKLNSEILNYIRRKVSERKNFISSLKKDSYSNQDFQQIYDDGSVDEFLSHITQGQEKNPNLNRMVTCMRNQFDISMVGTSLDFIALFAIARGAMGTSSSLSQLPNYLKNALAATLSGSSELIKACMSKNKMKDRFSGNSSGHMLPVHKTHLPSGFVIDLYTLDSVKMNSIPSCKEQGYDHIFLEQSLNNSCLDEALINIFPAAIGLSVVAKNLLLIDE